MDDARSNIAVMLPKFFMAIELDGDEPVGSVAMSIGGSTTMIACSESNLRTLIEVAKAALQHLRNEGGNIHG